MKKISVITTISIVGMMFIQGAFPAFAVYTVGTPKLVNQVHREQNQASRAAQRQSNQLQNIINRSNTMITNRLTSLTTLSTRIQNDTRLSPNEKSTLSSDIQTAISGLTALKTKINADTDATTAKSDEKTIITGYYVYAAFEPKIRYLIILNNLQTVTLNLQALVPQLQNLINTSQSKGANVTQLQSLLNDVSSQLQTVNATITTDIITVEHIPTTSKSAAGTFSNIRTNITQVVRTGFAKIRSDIEQMRPLFKQMILQNGVTPTPQAVSVTPTVAPSVTQTIPSTSPSTTP